MIRGKAASMRREVPRMKKLKYQIGLFYLKYFENGPLEPGYKLCSLQKNNLTWSPKKRSRPGLTYHEELLSNFISPRDLDNSTRMCSACRIVLTSSKSNQTAETFVKERDSILNLNLLGNSISCEITFKYERVVFDNFMTWKAHADYVWKKVASRVSILGRVRSFVTKEAATLVHNALILPLFDYCDIAWSNLLQQDIDRLQRLTQ